MKCKKLVAGALTAALSFGMISGTALAVPSPRANTPVVVNRVTSNPQTGAPYTDQYTITTAEAAPSFKALQTNLPAVASAITAINDAVSEAATAGSDAIAKVTEVIVNQLEALANSNDAALPESVKESAKQVLAQIEGKKQAVTAFFDLDKTGDNVHKTADGKYQVTLKVPALTNQTTGVVVLHFSTVRQEFELITPSNVDLQNQEITVEFQDLSPVMVLVDSGTADSVSNVSAGTTQTASGTTSGSTTSGSTTSGSSSTVSPKTGVDSQWMLFAGGATALAAGGAGVLAYRRRTVNAKA